MLCCNARSNRGLDPNGGVVSLKFSEILKEVTWRLITEERISYRSTRNYFDLDDEGVDELRSLLVQKKGLAIDTDGKFLVLAGTAAPTGSPRSNAPPTIAIDLNPWVLCLSQTTEQGTYHNRAGSAKCGFNLEVTLPRLLRIGSAGLAGWTRPLASL